MDSLDLSEPVITDSTYVFTITGEIPQFKEGSIMWSSKYPGYLREVTSVNIEGDVLSDLLERLEQILSGESVKVEKDEIIVG